MLFRRRAPQFTFHDPPEPLVGPGLTLVEPIPAYLPQFVASLGHPLCRNEPGCDVRPESILMLLQAAPRGRERCDPRSGCEAAYRFWMKLDGTGRDHAGVDFGGTITLRIGRGDDLLRYVGHIGYLVLPPARGRRLAARASRLLFPLARLHGLSELSITCDPTNLPSRRTIEAIGGQLVETHDVPRRHPLYARGERRKCRYVVAL